MLISGDCEDCKSPVNALPCDQEAKITDHSPEPTVTPIPENCCANVCFLNIISGKLNLTIDAPCAGNYELIIEVDAEIYGRSLDSAGCKLPREMCRSVWLTKDPDRPSKPSKYETELAIRYDTSANKIIYLDAG